MTHPEIESKLTAYHAAYRKGTDWLLAHANPDGSVGPATERLYYYRVPWTLALVGELAAASRKLDWIQRHMFTPEGAFQGLSPLGVFEHRYGSYPIACLLVGAVLLRRHNLIYPGTQDLLTWQDPETGGFFNDPQDKSADGEQELFPTCQGGMTLLLVGHLEAARQAGEWLQRLWSLQPDASHRLYHCYSRRAGLITEFPSEQARQYVTRKDEPYQHHYDGGIAAAFLTKLYLATDEKRWLDLARRYQDFSMTTDESQFQSMQVCKSGWGAGMLYLATREADYRDWTVRMGDWFLEHQHDDGHWENTKFLVPNPTLADNMEVTAEFTMHLANIVVNLAVPV